MNSLEFDYVIVGGGSAGALLANRLSEDGKHSVLLAEAGSRDTYPWIHVPVGYLYCIDNPRTDWRFRTEAEKGLNGRSLLYPRGKVLGGCSSINGMLYMRGQARDYEQWAEATGESDWGWQGALADFKRHEDHHRLRSEGASKASGKQRASNEFHASGGEWRVDKQRLRWDVLDAFSQAAQQAGLPATDDFNRGNNEGVGYFEVNQKNGWRWNTSKAFIRPALPRKNLHVWTGAKALKLQTEKASEGPRCVGVDLERNGMRISVKARREVIVSCGAVGTPQLLQLSGIGPADELRKHGIAPVRDLAGVGGNLQDHLQVRAIFKIARGRTLNTIANSLWGKAMIGLEYAWRRTGPMSMAPSQLCAITRSDPSQQHPNIQFHVQPLSLPAFGQPLHNFPAVTASVCNLNPTSRGKVSLRSSDPHAAPVIAPNYLSTPEDRKVAADSLRVARQIMAQSALAPYGPSEFLPGAQHQSDEELAKVAGDIATTIFHPVGTARMGRVDDPSAVVDPHLRVIGVSRLRVVDASVMPTITSGNTNSPTLMIAEKAARWIQRGE